MDAVNPDDIEIFDSPLSPTNDVKEFWIDPDDDYIGSKEPGQKQRTTAEWTDERCLIEVQKCCVWKEIPEDEMEGHLISFANLWLSGEEENPKNIRPKIRNVLLMFPLGLSNKLLFQTVFDSAVKKAQAIPAVGKEKSILNEPLVDHLGSKDKAAVLAFHDWLRQNFLILRMGREKNTSTDQPNDCTEYDLASQKLRCVLGFCALVLMRIMTKSEEHIIRSFPRSLNAKICNIALVAPSQKLLNMAARVLSGSCRDNVPRHLFSLLVFQYLKSSIEGSESSLCATEILSLGCLGATAGNGMGLVTLYLDVWKICTDIEARRLLHSTICSSAEDDESYKRLTKFLGIYVENDKPQYSWKWARILCQNYFSDLNVKKNQSLCSKLAALQQLVHKKRVFEHKDLQPPNPFADSAIEWAKSVKTELGILNSRERYIKSAQDFLKCMGDIFQL